jgi:hypothetical protein
VAQYSGVTNRRTVPENSSLQNSSKLSRLNGRRSCVKMVSKSFGEVLMRFRVVGLALVLTPLLALGYARAEEAIRIELNSLENADARCRMSFVIENKNKQALDSLKLDLALFNAEGAMFRRMMIDVAPVRPAKTIVRTFATDGDCAQIGSLLLNEVAACVPGEPVACQDDMSLSSRIKTVRFYK